MIRAISFVAICLLASACDRTEADIYSVANGCFAIQEAGSESYLVGQQTEFGFNANSVAAASAVRLRASDLGHYLLYDAERNFFIASSATTKDWSLVRTDDPTLVAIPFHQTYSDADWALESADRGANVYYLQHLNSELYLSDDGLVERSSATKIALTETDGCREFPELSVDAKGTPRSQPWPNGDVYGFADLHSHLFTNEGFGGGGIFHGAPFHRLGVEHALGDCEEFHGEEGRRDIVDFFLSGESEIDIEQVVPIFTTGQVDGFNHATTGYPVFADWPNPRSSKTHQQQYYRWLERSYWGGLRLVIQLATGNSALCELLIGLESQEAPYTCNDMVSVDRQIDGTRALERYIDAQHGGPGKGWFRVVETPQEARDVINKGQLAVVMGIEISNVFDCFLTPPEGMPICDAEHVRAEVEEYFDKGIRVVFPVHKYDNGFAAGDGSDGAIEIGNIMNSGHYNDQISDCPDFRHNFDSGNVTFGGLNRERDEYVSAPPLDMSELDESPISALSPLMGDLASGEGLEGDYCQAQGLTEVGKVLMEELTSRGMVIDLAHLPRWATVDAFEILDAKKYPIISTHGLKYDGKVYQYKGLSDTGFSGCASTESTDTMGDPFRAAHAAMREKTDLPGVPLAFDLNGFAGSRGPRFGDDSGCAQPQANPITYPFKSFDGQVEFTQPIIGERTIDFNTEGILHVGLFPELVQDVRLDGMSDAELEPLFHSAEAFIQSWEAMTSKAQ